MKTKALFISLIMLLALSTIGMAASVTPVVIPNQPGGEVAECDAVGDFLYAYKIDGWDEGSKNGTYPVVFEDGHANNIVISNSDGTYFDWSASPNSIGAVIVKGGNSANLFFYDPQVFSDSGLYSPVNNSGNPAEVSHVTFCWNPDPKEDEGEWCSPGYWRQPQHLDSWAVTGYSPTDSFSSIFGYEPTLSKLGVTNGATANPTLWEVLQAPQFYGGDAFNAVGDLLSRAHPDVNFQGTRVPDSCPLN
ncbi:MAG: hypothetical protein CVU40_16935 [Chloroflexi bacterium HGW-Chloroflexi-2]|jgi:hypothetical protein|nr:MAG: hypothetical protein CVU40_16935 [Chloroflexi bacterium HGW-Chloroflexi-2]